MKPIKVVRIFSRLNIGGPSIHVILLSQHLPAPYETILVTGKIGEREGDMSYLMENARSYRYEFIPELGREIHFWQDAIAFLKILKLLWNEKPQVVHTHTSKAGLLGRLAAVVARVPVRIHTFHGHVFHDYYSPLKSRIIRGVEKFLGYFTTQIIAISHKQKREIVEDFRIVSEKKVKVIPLGFDLSPFCKKELGRSDAWRTAYNIPKQRFLIGIVGRLVPIKNHPLFLKIAQKVLLVRDDVHFVIVGDGPSYRDVYQLAENMNMLQHVTFTGWQKNLSDMYSQLTMVCLTSLNEGTPVSIIEAQANGVPVLSTRVGGTPDIIFSGKNGYLFDVDDVAGFTGKILYLLDRPEERKKMGEFGRSHVLNHFDKSRLLMDIDVLYKDVLKELSL